LFSSTIGFDRLTRLVDALLSMSALQSVHATSRDAPGGLSDDTGFTIVKSPPVGGLHSPLGGLRLTLTTGN
jgi:hypothetical protein